MHIYFTMKTYLFAAAVAISGTLISCGNNDKVDAIDQSLVTPTEASTTTAPAQDGAVTTPQDVILPDSLITNPKIIEKMSAPSTPTTSAAVPVQNKPTAAGLNPEHGQPGHRCDIAVGAPLNSAPAAKPAATTTTPSITPSMTPTAMPASTMPSTPAPAGAKLNPAHGQPGHDCAIPVGAPLKG